MTLSSLVYHRRQIFNPQLINANAAKNHLLTAFSLLALATLIIAPETALAGRFKAKEMGIEFDVPHKWNVKKEILKTPGKKLQSISISIIPPNPDLMGTIYIVADVYAGSGGSVNQKKLADKIIAGISHSDIETKNARISHFVIDDLAAHSTTLQVGRDNWWFGKMRLDVVIKDNIAYQIIFAQEARSFNRLNKEYKKILKSFSFTDTEISIDFWNVEEFPLYQLPKILPTTGNLKESSGVRNLGDFITQ